jgi:uncharacterized protein YggT (Ycf19 family)
MNIFIYASLFLLVWIISGFVRFFQTIGYKNHVDTWYDKIVMTPLIPITHIFGAIGFIVDKFRNEDEFNRKR